MKIRFSRMRNRSDIVSWWPCLCRVEEHVSRRIVFKERGDFLTGIMTDPEVNLELSGMVKVRNTRTQIEHELPAIIEGVLD